MDNLKNKLIKQYYYDTDNDEGEIKTIVITSLKDRQTGFTEWYGHVKGYGTVIFLFGGQRVGNHTYKETANYCASEYYDEILDTTGED